ncbi:MAG TPA: chromosomal replication initiator protein DnaA [Patescibacteria group bacterium]|nr:chromosomal replication initiator protein DnaA [Patescibacteria group bacterium]
MADQLVTLWEDILKDIKKKVSTANFLTLFNHTALISLEDNIATIAAPSTMICDMLQKRFSQDIKSLLESKTGTSNDILFITRSVPAQTQIKEVASPLFSTSSENTLIKDVQPERTSSQPLAVGHLPRVRSDYTFANFAVSGSNQLAFTAASTVAKHIGTFYNPLFIYGPVGVGKTHLMHALANQIYAQSPDKKIIYITSEEFTNEVVEAIRTNSTANMKRRFRSAILLLIDDIQFIEGKEKVQEELFHTFNILIDNHAQICLSSDRPPQEIKKLEKRLSSRFAGGLTVDIEAPDVELKTAILRMKAEKFGHSLPLDIATLLAEKVEDTRSLEGLLLRVITQAAATGGEITLDTANKALGILKEERTTHIHAEDVIKTVCDFYGVKPTQLRGPKRDAALVKARQITMYLLKEKLELTYVEIGNILGGRDHTTVMHGVDKIVGLVENKAKISDDILGITKSLNG